MIVHKRVRREYIPEGVPFQLTTNGLCHYTYEHKVTDDERIGKAMDCLDRVEAYPSFYDGVAEPGYDDRPTITADWNKVPNNFCKWLSTLDVNHEWLDEWESCCHCNKLVRTQGDCYGWTRYYTELNDGDLLCHDCAPEFWADIEETLINNDQRAVTPGLVHLIEKNGWTCLEMEDGCARYETGWHNGQNDDPKEVAAGIKENLPNHDFIFGITSVGQFDVSWTCYIRVREEEE